MCSRLYAENIFYVITASTGFFEKSKVIRDIYRVMDFNKQVKQIKLICQPECSPDFVKSRLVPLPSQTNLVVQIQEKHTANTSRATVVDCMIS